MERLFRPVAPDGLHSAFFLSTSRDTGFPRSLSRTKAMCRRVSSWVVTTSEYRLFLFALFSVSPYCLSLLRGFQVPRVCMKVLVLKKVPIHPASSLSSMCLAPKCVSLFQHVHCLLCYYIWEFEASFKDAQKLTKLEWREMRFQSIEHSASASL